MCNCYVFPLRTSETELVRICKTCYSRIPYMCALYSRTEDEWKFCGSLHFFKFFKRKGSNPYTGLLGSSYPHQVDRDTAVRIVTLYGLDRPVIESRWGGRDFPHPSRPDLLPTQCPVHWVSAHFPGSKAEGAWHCPSTPI